MEISLLKVDWQTQFGTLGHDLEFESFTYRKEK